MNGTLTAVDMSPAVVMVAGNSFTNTAGADAISVPSGGKFLIYSVAPSLDVFDGLTGSYQYGISYPALPSFTGNGLLFSNPLISFTLQSQQSLEANNVFTSFDTPMPGAATHGGEMSSVIDTPTDTDVYKRFHHKEI